MVEIKLLRYSLNLSELKHILYVLILLFIPAKAHTQDTSLSKKGIKKIEILNADIWEVNEKIEKDLQRLLGNVVLKHNEVKMSCDSAYYFKKKNQVKAFSKIHIEQGDTLDLYGNYLFYDGTLENASVDGNVELVDKETHLFTKSLEYDVKNQIARYNKNGRIINSENTLTSKIGVYYVSDNLFHFKDSVKIVNPDCIMKADTMDYNTKTETAFFTGPTDLNGDSLSLYCEKGWYDTKNDVTHIWKNAIIDNRKQTIHGDSLFFDDKTGYGQSFGNVVIEDTTKNLIIQGNYAWYYKQPERFMVTDRAMFIQVSKGDSLFLHADTISAITVSDTSANGYRLMRAYYGCRIFSKDMQAKCDSLSYSFQDSVIRFYTSPVIWSEENQLTSDSMAIFTKNSQTDRLELYNSAFITSQIDTIRFNQIKGRSLTGYFKNNKLYKIDIKGNGESIYYLLDGEDIAGVNQTKCANIEIYVENGKISEIYEYQNPEGFIDPPEPAKPNELRLKGYNWFDSLRPKKKADIFKK
ncbi:MAG: organic solvent tolerance protein OstA [Bacteroidia bacterium]|nr:organic solvent tolerance protein OstA [Bacteroidia bacterium]